MTKYTRENPFQFEGTRVWRNADGYVQYKNVGWAVNVPANAMHAFIEAENHVWHEDGTGFRKGRWIAVGKEDSWHVRHDDFEGSSWAIYTGGGGVPFARNAAALLRDFLNWHEANYPTQPAEPTGLGAVVEVAYDGGLTWYAHCGGGCWTRWNGAHVVRWESLIKDADGPVTVLSEGVTK